MSVDRVSVDDEHETPSRDDGGGDYDSWHRNRGVLDLNDTTFISSDWCDLMNLYFVSRLHTTREKYIELENDPVVVRLYHR